MPVVLIVSILNDLGFFRDIPDMFALPGRETGFLFDHVPLRLLSAITLIIGQIWLLNEDPASKALLDDCVAHQWSFKLRRTTGSGKKELKDDESAAHYFIFRNEDLFEMIDFGVFYLLDHPYLICRDKHPIEGDHRYYIHI